ncbi:MAG: DNA-processing protein DprA [Bacillales bacterium]|nr:DNA-processing protein DprA [Bacillales bacterium]MDY6002970.1 DNA-processing protein DprA [Bacilli bacterium]
MNTKEFVLALSKVKRWGLTKVANYVIKHGYDFEECLNFLELELDSNELRSFKNNLLIAQEEIKTNENKNIKLITLFDNDFPKKLCECSEPVIYLFYVGDISLLSSKCLTIIGTRNPTKPFISLGEKAAKYFAEKGYTIVSGLALGCDAIGHKAALDANGKTIAILPSSLDKVVPTQHRELARDIARKGGLVISECSVTSTMNKFNYPQRDRIQSLLSNVTIVIQSANDGGTMIAVKKSLKDGKKVYAIEGNDLDLINDYLDIESEDQLRKIENEL